MSGRRQLQLLDVEPHDKLTFRLDRQASCTIRLSNNSRFLAVAFKVSTTNNRLKGGPSYGILNRGSVRYVEVTLVGQMEAPNMQRGDKVIIRTLVGSRDDTEESLPTLFRHRAAMVESYELKVVYHFSGHQQSSNIGRSSGAGSSLNASAFQQPEGNRSPWHLLENAIVVVFSCLIFWYLAVQILSRLWTMISMVSILVLRMMRNTAVEAAEDQIKRIVVYLCLYFLAAVRENLLRFFFRLLDDVSNALLDLFTTVFGHGERRRRNAERRGPRNRN